MIKSMDHITQWLISRVALVYIVIIIFCFTCVDLKMVEMRIKVKHLNGAMPDFSDIIVFSKEQKVINNIDEL